ncbi:GntR family transcriptional regulator [Novosphingobium sp. PS1R-30]|uniref:GntR family transcriptional regulator n=1 Tax=Novosphingobium anseongense TaxID=3133436 RepID=A0ABU8RX52_9SPHN
MKRSEQSPVASQRVADVVAERILTGQLKPGDRIKQDELASELNLSRIPVRDALRILETRGLVSLKANAGARVASLGLRDMELSYQIREMLEPMLLAESIPNLVEADFGAMAEIKARLEKVTDADDYMPLARAFHWTAFRGHQVPLLAQIVERLWDTTHHYRRAYAVVVLKNAELLEVMRAERDLLFGAIQRRETDLAPRILAAHIRRTHIGLLEHSEALEAEGA